MADKIVWQGNHLDGKLTITSSAANEIVEDVNAPREVHYFLVAADCQFTGSFNLTPTPAGIGDMLKQITENYVAAITADKNAGVTNGTINLQ